MPDPLNLLSKVNDALFGGRNDGLPPLPSPFDGPETNAPGNGPGPNDPGLDTLPPGLEGRDSIPYGVAKQLDLPAPPAPPPLPGAPSNPGGNQAPTSPMTPPPMSGNGPSVPTAPTSGGQPIPATGGAAQPLPVPVLPPNSSGQPFLAQFSQAVQAFIAQTLARGADPRAPAAAAPTNNPATPNPVPPAAQAQAAQANPLQTGAPTQGSAGVTGQPVGTTAPAGAAVPAGNPAATQAAQVRAGAPEAAPQQLPQGRPDAVPAQQRPEGSLLDRLMSLLRPTATTTTQGSLAPNVAGTTQAATATTVAALPLAIQPTQAPMDARGNTLLAVNDRAATQRADVMLAGIYTADGPYRRGLRRGSNVLSAQFSRLLMALGLAGPPVTMRGRDAEYELSVALQWLFWLLALVAYACLGLAMIAFLPAGSDVLGGSGRGWTTGFAIAGLIAGAGAWWFARQLSARGGNRERTPESGSEED